MMVNIDTIDLVLDYIDENIRDNIKIDKLAEVSAYSASHFFRLFLSHMDMTPKKYILRRKLYFSAKEILNSDIKIVDVAYSYGFESHDVFSRAFKRYYGISPTLFRNNNDCHCISDYAIPVTQQLVKRKDERNMLRQADYNVQIVTLPETKLIGIERKIGGAEWSFDVFYRDYDRIFRNAPNRAHPNSTNATYATSKMLDDGSYMYYVGIEVTSLEDIPEGAIGKVIPAQMCAMIRYDGDIDYMDVINYLYSIWFEQNTFKTGHLLDYPYCAVEYYSPNKECEVYNERVYIPIQQMDYEIVTIPSYRGYYYRAISESGSASKDEAFSVMLQWASDNHLFDSGEVKFEVYYGKEEDDKIFCEILYRTDNNFFNTTGEKVQIKQYPTRKYFHTSSIHHFLEPNSRAIWRFIEKNNRLTFSHTGEPYYRPYFEEYRLKKARLDMYTPLDIYVCID